MDEVVIAYSAESAASAPAPRGLPLSAQAPSRHSAVVAGARSPALTGATDEQDEAAPPATPSAAEAGEDGPPLEELEAQMHADVISIGSAEAPSSARRIASPLSQATDEEGESPGPLPALDELVARLPTDVRETLEEIFRAKFVSVKKLPRAAFASAVKSK